MIWYTCTWYCMFWFFPPGTPDAPRNLAASSPTASSITLSWDAPRNDGGSPVKGYVLERRQPFSARWQRVSRELIEETRFKITDLIEGSEYEFQVSAVNEAGTGEASDTLGPIIAKDPFGECHETLSLLGFKTHFHFCLQKEQFIKINKCALYYWCFLEVFPK